MLNWLELLNSLSDVFLLNLLNLVFKRCICTFILYFKISLSLNCNQNAHHGLEIVEF